ncbi:hypothetical protein CAPTEDRAFT_195597 [Capitella teleta]|uniref:Major facilitator superfamily (MFS) profile domain-containing protein n=1 Tax=Capitella teleta TaxID=283909 RepID=R7UA04_CAPTE|nr:hypothetical protein CAPTEDRAFT_195597 [Capitella teleta]|eukprot:ELU03200.1 hypothetical protein CAPTEDRAFT_195597 [Capitella teleta]
MALDRINFVIYYSYCDENECKEAIFAEENREEEKKTQEHSSPEDRYYDQGYAWVVAVCAFVVTFMVSVNIVSFGVLLTEFALHFDLPFAQLSILAAIRMGFTYCSGIIAGTLVHRFGCRPVGILGLCCSAAGCLSAAFIDNFILLILTFGFLAGFGAGVLYVVPLVVISKFFKKKRVLATSVSSAGFSFGSVVFGLSGGFIIESVGWRYTLALMAMLNVQGLVAVFLFFDQIQPRKQTMVIKVIPDETMPEIEVKKAKKSACVSMMSKLNFMDVSLLKNRNFAVFALATLPTMSGTMAFYALGPNRAYIQGVSKVQSSFISAAVGSCSFIGRILSGVIGNRKIISSKLHFSLAVLAAGSIIALSTLAGAWLSLHMTFAAMFGIFFGNYEGIGPTVIVDILGLGKLSKALGWVQLARGLCAFVTLPLAGLLYDASGGYTVPFLAMSAFQISGGLLVLSLQLPCAKRHTSL